MKKIIYLLLISVFAIGLQAQDKTPSIKDGNTYVDISFDASDTINESETYWIEVTNEQPVPQVYDIWIDLTDVSGTPSVVVQVSGKKFADDSYTDIGTAATWTDTDFNYPVDSAKEYRFIKILFTASATEQQTLIAGVEVKTWNVGNELTASSATYSGNVAVGGTIEITGATTLTGAVGSAASITLGDGADVVGSATSDITINTDKFTVAGATGNTVIAGKLDATSERDGGANTANMFNMTYNAGETFTGTTGHQFKGYDEDNTVVHSGGEHAIVYANMKLLSAMAGGGKSVLYSGHNYGTGGDYQIIDAGTWLYGNFVDAFKVSGGSIVTGLDLSETTITGQEILGENSESLDNGTDGVWNMGTAALQASLYNFADATAVAGTADAITIDFTADLTVVTGTMITFVAEDAVTGAATLDVDGAGALAINKYNGAASALDANDMRSGQVVTVVYNGTLWIMMSPSGN